MRFIVTGPTCNLGSIFVARLLELGKEVVVLHYVDPQIPGTNWCYWKLGEPLPEDQRPTDIIIHCAFDRRSLLTKGNQCFDSLATLRLIQSLNKKQRLLLPASHSAAENALSFYGKAKFLQQEIIKLSGQINFFVGYLLDADEDSNFQLRHSILSIIPFIFVPFRQQMSVVVTKEDSVRDFIDQLTRNIPVSDFMLQSQVMTFRAFLRKNGFRGAFIAIPDSTFTKSLQLIRALRVPVISAAADSLLSLLRLS